MKKSFLWLGVAVTAIQVSAGSKRIVECRLVTAKTTECKPYPSKFMFTKELTYGDQKHKLIISKTLPVTKRPKLLKIIDVEDMIEDHLEVLEPVRFSGSKPSPMRMSLEEIARRKAEQAKRKEMERELAALKLEKERLERQLVERKRAEVMAQLEKKITETEAAEKERLAKEREKAEEKRRLAEEKKRAEEKKKLAEKKKAEERKKKEKKALAKKKKKTKKSKLARKLEKKYRYLNKKTRNRIINEYETKLFRTLKGKHKLRVQATAYSSHVGQTDSTPFLAAWNNRLRPGMKAIAVSRDLIKKYGLGNGKKVRIQGLPGYYTVRDKMNKRYTKRIDIYMGTNRRKALRWGRKRVIIYW
jgi:3D (Asp-Asp-Asp) domain-containing protein